MLKCTRVVGRLMRLGCVALEEEVYKDIAGCRDARLSFWCRRRS